MYLEGSPEPQNALKVIASALFSGFSVVDPEASSGSCSKIETNIFPFSGCGPSYPTDSP